MSNKGKQLSNSSSTGGLGTHFENRVQASFVVLMLTGGFVPCLPTWPIKKIKLQGKYQNYDTDDLIVYLEQSGSKRGAKLIGQIKHSIRITEGDKVFAEVIKAAWSDFNKNEVFTEGTDLITLICGPLSATDTCSVRDLLGQAEYSENAVDFTNRIKLGNFTSDLQRNKLNVFQHHLSISNGNRDLSDDQIWRFLKSFRLLIYDLDIKGVTLSLLHSLIGQYSKENIDELWAYLQDNVERVSEHAGFITIESISSDIRTAFQRRITETIPAELAIKPLYHEKFDWDITSFPPELVIANLIGSWNENSDEDIAIVGKLAKKDYATWISGSSD